MNNSNPRHQFSRQRSRYEDMLEPHVKSEKNVLEDESEDEVSEEEVSELPDPIVLKEKNRRGSIFDQMMEGALHFKETLVKKVNELDSTTKNLPDKNPTTTEKYKRDPNK
jgi:hypothetical protein